MQRLCVHKSLVRLPAFAFFTKTWPVYEKLHGRPFRSIATMVQNLINREFLGILLRHDNRIRAFGVVVEWPEVMDVCHYQLIVDKVLRHQRGTWLGKDPDVEELTCRCDRQMEWIERTNGQETLSLSGHVPRGDVSPLPIGFLVSFSICPSRQITKSDSDYCWRKVGQEFVRSDE